MLQTRSSAMKGVSLLQQSLQEIRPARTDRAALLGQTGTGKTTLARFLLAQRKYKVVADYKGRIDWPEYQLCRTLKALVNSKKDALLYKPNYGESVDVDKQSAFWEWVYRRGGTTAYIDELTTIANRQIYPWHYGACLVRGRELGIEVWSGTQRPKDIPQITLSESEHFYTFRLNLPQDRERVEAVTGINKDSISELQKRQFFYSRQDGGVFGPMQLTVSPS